jgi:hypothetical protein
MIPPPAQLELHVDAEKFYSLLMEKPADKKNKNASED